MVKNLPAKAGDARDMDLIPGLEKEMATRSSILAWKSHGQKSLAGCSPWDRKGSDMTEHTHTHALQESGQVRVTFPRQPSSMQAAVVSIIYHPASPQVGKILMDVQRWNQRNRFDRSFFQMWWMGPVSFPQAALQHCPPSITASSPAF